MALCINTQKALNQQGCLVQMTTGPGMFPRSHFHSGIEFILVHDGGARISTRDWSATASPCSMVIIPGQTEHSTEPLNQRFRRTVIHVADELCDTSWLLTDRGHRYAAVSLSADAFDRCFWIARQLQSLTSSHRRGLTKILTGLMDVIKTEVEIACELPVISTDHNALIAEITGYMNANLTCRDDSEQLARHFGISERNLFRLFSTELKYSPQKYWLHLRLERACQLLSTGMPVEKISRTVGFDTVRGFQRAFKRMYGISPSEYL
jgi:AraC-like DNA-binding protein